MSDLELEKVKLVNAGSERLRAVKDIKQERDQLLNEVKTSRNDLNNLTGNIAPVQILLNYRSANDKFNGVDSSTIVEYLAPHFKYIYNYTLPVKTSMIRTPVISL